jgi:hypothetical protein
MNTTLTAHTMAALAALHGGILRAPGNPTASVPMDYPLSITSIRAEAGSVELNWMGGRPTYQVQTRSDLDGPWVNVGPPLRTTSITLPLASAAGYFRIVSDFTARYQVVFDATWSARTHPQGFTPGAHWSGLVGATHDSRVHFWRPGETSSEGIRLMAEQGRQLPLLSEVAAAQTNGTAHLALAGSGISPSPGSTTLVFPDAMRRDHSLVTLCSMVAPSPDWFVAVESLNMVENGDWVREKSVDLFPYDAGTDSGLTFTAPDLPTIPRGVATPLLGYPAIQDGVLVPFGCFRFTRLD